jgi:PLD-like domain
MHTQNKKHTKALAVRAYQGDAKTLLAFDLPEDQTINLAGFTIKCAPKGKTPYYLYNLLQFAKPNKHAMDKDEPAYSSINAPFQKFRWLHVPGNFHQLDKVFYGPYKYTITPRYFNDQGVMQPIDETLSTDVQIDVQPFVKGKLQLGFTRGFVQSQAFVHHFGRKALFKPKNATLLFDTSVNAGKNDQGDAFTFADEYEWSGFTARIIIFDLLKKVEQDADLTMDVFAYDLNEPDVMKALLELAKKDKVRIILDNASLHHSKTKPKHEDEFEKEMVDTIQKPTLIKRGKFDRFQHNKVFVIYRKKKAEIVLTGSTNFSVTGMYVNSNHVAVFHDTAVAGKYAEVFAQAWADNVDHDKFVASPLSQKTFPFALAGISKTEIRFSPHDTAFATETLDNIVSRISNEKQSVLFAVMNTDAKVTGPLTPVLIDLHERTDIFSGGITDSKNSLTVYKPSSRKGFRVSGTAGATILPPPFDQEASIGIGHQVHHKFVVCGFNSADPVVWFGSSNLAQGGEEENGDNLIEIHDEDIATVFAIEAIALIDHFNFRNKFVAKSEDVKPKPKTLPLSNNSKWSKGYYQETDLHFLDRLLFIGKSIF